MNLNNLNNELNYYIIFHRIFNLEISFYLNFINVIKDERIISILTNILCEKLDN